MVHIKKKHHFVPITYLNGFTDSSGKIYAYRKDDVLKPVYCIPDNIAYRNYYYSQPLESGGWDHNTFEDFFSDAFEGKWNEIKYKLTNQIKLSLSELKTFYMFNLASRVRVPASRDAVEFFLSQRVMELTKKADSDGLLPAKPAGLENLWDKCVVSIDPHQSIRAMAEMAKIVSLAHEEIGLEIIKNTTSIPFITSDNPVAFYDSSQAPIKPYSITRKSKEIEYLFPIDSFHLLRGHSNLKQRFVTKGITYRNESSIDQIQSYSIILSKFAYEWVYCSSNEQHSIITLHAAKSPILELPPVIALNRHLSLNSYVFGSRRKKPKWVETNES